MIELQNWFNKYRTNLTAIGVIGKFRGKSSLLEIKCKHHGLLSKFGNPSTPNFESLEKKTFDCPKCSKRYKPTEAEAISELNSILPSRGLIFNSFLKTYQGRHTKCQLSCIFHGDLTKFKEYRYPDIDNLMNAKSGCFLCAKEQHQLSNMLKKMHQFDATRNLYYAEFLDRQTSKLVAYKIGVCFRTIKLRYYEKGQITRGIKIGKKLIIKLPNILCLLTEIVILAESFKERKYPPQLENWGKSECFRSDVIGIDSLDNLTRYVEHAKQFFSLVVKSSALSPEEKEAALDKWKSMGYGTDNQLNGDDIFRNNLIKILHSKSK